MAETKVAPGVGAVTAVATAGEARVAEATVAATVAAAAAVATVAAKTGGVTERGGSRGQRACLNLNNRN